MVLAIWLGSDLSAPFKRFFLFAPCPPNLPFLNARFLCSLFLFQTLMLCFLHPFCELTGSSAHQSWTQKGNPHSTRVHGAGTPWTALYPVYLSASLKPRSLKTKPRAGEIVQRLRTPTALPEVLSSNPSNHMGAHNHL